MIFLRYKYKKLIKQMKDAPLISVVTPIYNGSHFVKSTYECLCRQSYPNWEWVVVDDGSTDGTKENMRQIAYTDHRIKYTRQANTGSAKQPRDRAVFQASGNLILPLDIDDLIADDYLLKQKKRMDETQAEIVYPQMIFINLGTGQQTNKLPVKDFDLKRVYLGRDLIKETIPEWRIGCNGGLYQRNVWVNMSWLEDHEPIWTYSDEVDERYYLLKAQRVAFSQAEYYYRNHENSITNKPSLKLFHILKNNCQLTEFIKQEFGKDSEEYRLAMIKAFNGWRNMMAYYLKHYEELTDADSQIMKDLTEAYSLIERSKLPLSYRLEFLNLPNVHLIMILMAMKYAPKWIGEKLQQHFFPEKYRFKVIRERSERQTQRQLQHSYANDERKQGIKPYAICMSCGNVANGGLVDRLRGAISLYEACLQNGRQFRLFFTHPFALTDYLLPNEYNWTIDANEVSFSLSQAQPVIIDTLTNSSRERQWQEKRFGEELNKNTQKQLHFYSNAHFCYDHDFGRLFHQLFKPSERLQESIDKQLKVIGNNYITVSARFCNMLNDFNEETLSEALPKNEQKKLIEACLKQLRHIHLQHADLPIVVCSDSITFTEHAQKEAYVKVIPGIVSYIGNDTPHYYQYYEKTFLDFFVISKAQQIYLLKTTGMHNSGFPYAASRVENKPYHIIEF